MSPEVRKWIGEPAEFAALAHPLRLDLINHLMAAGPATASVCARAVGDTPSNCSYHLRVLERSGLVVAEESTDGRERPWRATITGFGVNADQMGSRPADALIALSVQRDHRLTREYLARRSEISEEWRAADGHATYTLRMTPQELDALGEQLDALIRPYLAATREGAPVNGALVHLGLHAFPLIERT
ncbi:MAG TPA: helix-turn-helix domain-containing protein [Mycobacteriales bacterium]